MALQTDEPVKNPSAEDFDSLEEYLAHCKKEKRSPSFTGPEHYETLEERELLEGGQTQIVILKEERRETYTVLDSGHLRGVEGSRTQSGRQGVHKARELLEEDGKTYTWILRGYNLAPKKE